MTITLKNLVTNATVTLNPDLKWTDENNWHPVEQNADRTITGALVVQIGVRVGGRPYTLEPEDDSSAWMNFSEVEQLRNWAAVPGLQMTLTLRGIERAVIFRHQDGGFEAEPVVFYRDVAAPDFYRCVIRLMEM